MCNTESVVEVETVGLQLAQWILDSKLVEHIFGPNLHVEVSTIVSSITTVIKHIHYHFKGYQTIPHHIEFPGNGGKDHKQPA